MPMQRDGTILKRRLLLWGTVIVFAKGFAKLAASMIVIPLGIAMVIGSYTHFLSAGSDNVLRMPASDLTLPFQISAMLLTLLEALGCWVGFRMLVFAPDK